MHLSQLSNPTDIFLHFQPLKEECSVGFAISCNSPVPRRAAGRKEPHQTEMSSDRTWGLILLHWPTRPLSGASRRRDVLGGSLPAFTTAGFKERGFLFSYSSVLRCRQTGSHHLYNTRLSLKLSYWPRRRVSRYTKKSGLLTIFLWLGFLTSVCSNLSGEAFHRNEDKTIKKSRPDRC